MKHVRIWLVDLPCGQSALRDRKRVGLSLPGAFAAAFMAGSFHSLRVAGNVLTRIAPGMTRRVWQI